MLVDVKVTETLSALQQTTGKPYSELVNDILDIHLDEKRRNRLISKELDWLLHLYNQRRQRSEA